MRRGGVEAVFDELLDDGGGTLDYLAGGYAVYCLGGEGADWCHGCCEEAKSSAAGSTAAGGPERNAKCTRNAVDEAEIWREAQQVFATIHLVYIMTTYFSYISKMATHHSLHLRLVNSSQS